MSVASGLLAALAVALAVYSVRVYGWRSACLVALGAVPPVALHHTLNFAVGGVFLPANSVPEYLDWPGSPHDAQSMTGGLKHSPLGLVVYAADLLFGKKGFLLHNLPLVLSPGGAVLVWVWQRQLRPVIVFVGLWAVLGWLAYAAQSTNWSGMCVSVRWFVPLLAPGFWVVALVLRHFPRYRPDFLWVAAWGVVIAGLNWWAGTWSERMPPGFWFLVAPALLGLGVIRLVDYLRPRPAPVGSEEMAAPPLSSPLNRVN